MKFTNVLPAAFAVSRGVDGVCATPTPECIGNKVSSRSYHAYMVDNYINLWKGDLSLVNQTLSPKLNFDADRFPSSSGVGSANLVITTAEEFGTFVNSSRQGFEKYEFEPFYWLGEGNLIAIRWYLDAILGNYTRLPTTLKPGDPLTYNGTDTLILNPCTGLVDQVDSAQDLITTFHALGLTEIPV